MGNHVERRGVAGAGAWIAVACGLLGFALWWADSNGAVEAPPKGAQSTQPAAADDAPGLEDLAPTEESTIQTERKPASPNHDAPLAPRSTEAAVAPPPEKGFFLRALGADGEPVPSAAVEWVLRTKLGGLTHSPIQGKTNEAGELEVAGAKEFFERVFAGGDYAAFVAAVGLRCAMPFNELAPNEADDAPGVTWVSEAPAPGAMIDVRVPAYGFVRFTWDPPIDPRGGALDAWAIQVRRRDGDHFPGWRAGGRVDVGATEWTFGPVGLGWKVWGQLSAVDLQGPLGAALGSGPTVPGETVDIPVPIAEQQRDLVAVRGRVEFTDGVTGSRASGWIQFGPPDAKRAPKSSIRFDGAQRFEVLLARAALPEIVTLFDNYVRAKWSGTGVVPATLSDERIVDLGIIAARPVPKDPLLPVIPLASGRVTDPSGTPIAKARVSLYGLATAVGEREQDPKHLSSIAYGNTDSDGHFDLEGSVALASDALEIGVSAGGFQRFPMQATTAGVTGLELTLERGVDVRFRLGVPRWVLMMEKISFRLGELQNARGDASMPAAEDDFPMRFRGVPDGTHVFTVEFGDGDWPLHREEVSVAGSAVDLGEVDLSDALRICRLRLTDAGGAHVAGGYADILSSGETPGRERSIDTVQVGDDGAVTFIVPRDAEGLRVRHRTAGTSAIPPYAIVRPTADGKIQPVHVLLGP